MLGFLTGVPAQLNILITRLSSTWAAKLDTLAGYLTSTWAAKLDTLAADYTTAKAAYLNASISSRAAEDTPLLDIPIASGIVIGGTGGVNNASASLADFEHYSVTAYTSSTTYVDVVNYTGQGVLNWTVSMCMQSTGSGAACEVLIDGVVVSSLSLVVFSASYTVHCLAGFLKSIPYWNGAVITKPVVDADQIPFKTSLQVRHKAGSGSGNTVTRVRYRKTA